tara:strand:+ start:2761 stop:3720 length:960 start_codon:yes stop_codon:yes gene_type:complete
MKALMYHYIREYNPEIPNLHFLEKDDFLKQLDFLDKKYGFITIEDFINSIKTSKNTKSGVVLTFDDGLVDHYEYVLPELVKRGLWGIFYIPGSILETKRILTVHKIQLLLAKFKSDQILDKLSSILTPSMIDPDLEEEHRSKIYLDQENHDRKLDIKALFNYTIKHKYKDQIADQLFSHFFTNEDDLFESTYLSVSQLKELSDSGMLIGSHAMNHHPMINLSNQLQEREIRQSFRLIEDCIGELEHKTFCYPQGLPHTFNHYSELLLERNKTLFSFAVESRDITKEDLLHNVQKLPRYDCNEFKHGISFLNKSMPYSKG